MDNTFKELSEETQKVYAEIVKTNLSAMSGIMVLMMNQSNALAKGDMNLASSAVVQSLLVAIEKLLQSLLKGDDYVLAIRKCSEYFYNLVPSEEAQQAYEDMLKMQKDLQKKGATNDSNS